MNLLRNLLEILEAGGPVMIPIVAVSVWMWVLIFFKAAWIRRVSGSRLAVEDCMTTLESTGDAYPCARGSSPFAGIAGFLGSGNSGRGMREFGEPERVLFRAAVLRHTRDLYRMIPAIKTLAAAAPLLGLLGTVSGMVDIFRVMGTYGMGNAQAMASGIKEALISTQAGLLVAIPGILAGQAMNRKVRNIHGAVLAFAGELARRLEKERPQCAD